MNIKRLIGILGTALLLAGPMAANANVINFSGTNVGAPSMNSDVNRPAFRFDFSVGAGGGRYRLETLSANFDTYIWLYSGSIVAPFNSSTPPIAANDDGGAGGCGVFNCSLIDNVDLSAGAYSLFIRGFNGATGNFTARASTVRGADITASVPEPATFALLGLGLAGLGIARRKRAVN